MPRKATPLSEDFPDDKATVEWLKAQKKSSQNTYKSYWQWFLEYTEMNGNQILEDKRKSPKGTWENKLMAFRKWSLKHTCEVHKKPLSENGAKTACGVVRAFFAYHYTPLALRRNDSAKIKKAKRVYEDYRLSKEDIARMSVVANLRDRYILVVGKSLGLRASDFIRLKVGDFTALDLESEPPISMGKLDTVKEGVPAYPFLDSDAVPIVKAYLESIDTSNPNKRMLDIKKAELTTVLRRLAKKANIGLGNKVLRFHCLRKFLSKRLSAVMAESNWKQIIGKEIDEKAYISEEQLREMYAKAMPETTFSNHNHRIMEIQQLQTTIDVLSQKIVEQTDEIAQLTGRLSERDVELEKLRRQLKTTNQNVSENREMIMKLLDTKDKR